MAYSAKAIHGTMRYMPQLDTKPCTDIHDALPITLVKKPPVLPRGKTAWGVVKRVRVVKTREDVVKTKLGVVFCLWGRRYSSSAFQRQHPRADARCLRPTRPY